MDVIDFRCLRELQMGYHLDPWSFKNKKTNDFHRFYVTFISWSLLGLRLVLGLPWGSLGGLPGALLGALWCSLGVSWAPPGASWGLLGPAGAFWALLQVLFLPRPAPPHLLLVSWWGPSDGVPLI